MAMPKAAMAAVPNDAMTLSSRKVDSGRAIMTMLAGVPMRSMCQSSSGARRSALGPGAGNGRARTTERATSSTQPATLASAAAIAAPSTPQPSHPSGRPPTRTRAGLEDEERIGDAVGEDHRHVDQHRRARVAGRLIAGAERDGDVERQLPDVHDAQVRDGDRFDLGAGAEEADDRRRRGVADQRDDHAERAAEHTPCTRRLEGLRRGSPRRRGARRSRARRCGRCSRGRRR